MRERRSSDWVVDLNGRHGIEAQVERSLERHPDLVLLRTSTNAYDRLDFQLRDGADRLIQLEVKEKKQPLSQGWRTLRPEVHPADLFVLDELALRKIVDAGRYAFLLVHDIPRARWVLWSTGDLLVASRVRHVRTIVKGDAPRRKGKLLLNLKDAGSMSQTLDGALEDLTRAAAQLERWWTDISPWPAMAGER